MKTFDIEVEWGGYNRGVKVFRISAATEGEAGFLFKEDHCAADLIETKIYRDDTELYDILSIREAVDACPD